MKPPAAAWTPTGCAPRSACGSRAGGVHAGAVAPISAANSRKSLWPGSFRRHCAIRSRATSVLPRRCASRAERNVCSGPPKAACVAILSSRPPSVSARFSSRRPCHSASARDRSCSVRADGMSYSARRCAAVAQPVQRPHVLLGEAFPRVRNAQHAREHDGERGLLRRDRALAVTGPAVPGLPPNQLRRSGFGERLEPVAFPRRRPQHRRHIGHDEARCCHRIVGAEVVVIVGFAREVDQLLQRGRCGPGILGSQRVLRFRGEPLEGETPARPLARRHPPVPAHVRARSRQRHEVVDLVPHRLRIGRRLRGTRWACAPVARELDLDALAHVRRAAPVEVPQCLPQAILVELGHHPEELLAVHSLRRHEGIISDRAAGCAVKRRRWIGPMASSENVCLSVRGLPRSVIASQVTRSVSKLV